MPFHVPFITWSLYPTGWVSSSRADDDGISRQVRKLDDALDVLEVLLNDVGLILVLSDPYTGVVEKSPTIQAAHSFGFFEGWEVSHSAPETTSMDMNGEEGTLCENPQNPVQHLQGAVIGQLSNEQRMVRLQGLTVSAAWCRTKGFMRRERMEGDSALLEL